MGATLALKHFDRHSLEILARAGALLPASLDVGETADAVVKLTVEEIASFAAVDLTAEGGEIERIASRGEVPPTLLQRVPAPTVHRAIDEETPRHVGKPPRLLVLPLSARGRPLGALTLARRPREAGFTGGEISLAEELARVAATALDNALRHRDTRDARRFRDEFLLLASHELATPMTPLRLNAELLAREARSLSSERNSEYLERVSQATVRGVDRIADIACRLLDVAQIITGRLDLNLEEMDLSEVVGEVVATLRPHFQHAGCDLTVELEPVSGRWDRRRVVQLVEHLLGNTLRYAAGAPVEVSVRREGAEAVLVVADQGIGVPPDLQARIFERFERLGRPETYGGLGLGLWVVRQIVRALGGEVELESEPGRGARFTVRLPLSHRGP